MQPLNERPGVFPKKSLRYCGWFVWENFAGAKTRKIIRAAGGAAGLTGLAGAGQVVLIFEGVVEGGALVVAEQAHGHASPNLGFAEWWGHRQATVVKSGTGLFRHSSPRPLRSRHSR